MTTEIKTIYDLLEYAKGHPNHQYVYYDGEWLVYPNDSSNYLKDVNINVRMMNVVEEWNSVLEFTGYTISHRAVRNFKIDYERAKKKVDNIRLFLEQAIIKVKDQSYNSLKKIEEDIATSRFNIIDNNVTILGSYWGGGWETKAFEIFDTNYDHGKGRYLMRIPYYMRGNVIGKKIFRFLLMDYARAFDGWSEIAKDYRIYNDDGTIETAKEYFKKEKEVLNRVYNVIVGGINNGQRI